MPEELRDGFVDRRGRPHLKGSDAHKASVDRRHCRRPYRTRRVRRDPAIKICNIVALLLLAISPTELHRGHEAPGAIRGFRCWRGREFPTKKPAEAGVDEQDRPPSGAGQR